MKSTTYSTAARVQNLLLGAGFLFVLPACTSVDSVSSQQFEKRGVGIPYHLPSGQVTLNLTFEESDKEGTIRITPKLCSSVSILPDPHSTYVLEPSHNGWFGTHHTITVANGLLTSVSTVETGEVKSAILSLVDTGIAVAKLKYGLGGPRAESMGLDEPRDIFLTDSRDPTEEEIAFIFGKVAGRTISAIPTTGNPDMPPIAGAEAFLKLSSKLEPIPPGSSPPSSAQPGNRAPEGEAKSGGVFTRAERPFVATLSLELNTPALRVLRHDALERAIHSAEALLAEKLAEKLSTEADRDVLVATATRLEADRDVIRDRRNSVFGDRYEPAIPEELLSQRDLQLTELDKALTAAETAVTSARNAWRTKVDDVRRLDREITLLGRRVATYRERLKHYLPTAPDKDRQYLAENRYLLHTGRVVVVLPDTATAVRVPITRAPIGTTTNTIKFKDGLLTTYESERPSSVAEFLKIPTDALSAVTESVSDIFQFRIDTNTARLNARTSDVETLEKLVDLNERMVEALEDQKNGSDGDETEAEAGDDEEDSTAEGANQNTGTQSSNDTTPAATPNPTTETDPTETRPGEPCT